MVIRRAQPGDEIALIEFSKLCYDEMGFDNNGYKFEYEAGLRNYVAGILDNSKLILTCWDRGVLVGLAVWLLSNKSQYFDNHLIASEIVFHALPSLGDITKLKVMRMLQLESTKYCKAMGVKSMFFQYDVRFPAVGRLMEKEGFKPFAVQMYKDLTEV